LICCKQFLLYSCILSKIWVIPLYIYGKIAQAQ
jgi:hypothetical protein